MLNKVLCHKNQLLKITGHFTEKLQAFSEKWFKFCWKVNLVLLVCIKNMVLGPSIVKLSQKRNTKLVLMSYCYLLSRTGQQSRQKK